MTHLLFYLPAPWKPALYCGEFRPLVMSTPLLSQCAKRQQIGVACWSSSCTLIGRRQITRPPRNRLCVGKKENRQKQLKHSKKKKTRIAKQFHSWLGINQKIEETAGWCVSFCCRLPGWRPQRSLGIWRQPVEQKTSWQDTTDSPIGSGWPAYRGPKYPLWDLISETNMYGNQCREIDPAICVLHRCQVAMLWMLLLKSCDCLAHLYSVGVV